VNLLFYRDNSRAIFHEIIFWTHFYGQDNIFEWHFTVRGPRDTEFEGGVYHGKYCCLLTEWSLRNGEENLFDRLITSRRIVATVVEWYEHVHMRTHAHVDVHIHAYAHSLTNKDIEVIIPFLEFFRSASLLLEVHYQNH